MKIRTFLFRVLPVAITSLLSAEAQKEIKKEYAVYFEENNSPELDEQFITEVLDKYEEEISDELDSRLNLEAKLVVYVFKNLIDDYRLQKNEDESKNKSEIESEETQSVLNETITKNGVKVIDDFFSNTNFDNPFDNPASPAKLLRCVIAQEYTKYKKTITPAELLYKNQFSTFQSNRKSKTESKTEKSQVAEELNKLLAAPSDNSNDSKIKHQNIDKHYLDVIEKAKQLAKYHQENNIHSDENLNLLRHNILAFMFYDAGRVIEFLQENENTSELRKHANITTIEAIKAHMLRYPSETASQQFGRAATLLQTSGQLIEYINSVQLDKAFPDLASIETFFNNVDTTKIETFFNNVDTTEIETFFNNVDTTEIAPAVLRNMRPVLLDRIINSGLVETYCKDAAQLMQLMQCLDMKNVKNKDYQHAKFLKRILDAVWESEKYLPTPAQLGKFISSAPAQSRMAELKLFLDVYDFTSIFKDRAAVEAYLDALDDEEQRDEHWAYIIDIAPQFIVGVEEVIDYVGMGNLSDYTMSDEFINNHEQKEIALTTFKDSEEQSLIAQPLLKQSSSELHNYAIRNQRLSHIQIVKYFNNIDNLVDYLNEAPEDNRLAECNIILDYVDIAKLIPNRKALDLFIAAAPENQQIQFYHYAVARLPLAKNPNDYLFTLEHLNNYLVVIGAEHRFETLQTIFANLSLEKAKAFFKDDAALRFFFAGGVVSYQQQMQECALIFEVVGAEHIYPTYDAFKATLEKTHTEQGATIRDHLWQFLMSQFQNPEKYITKRHELFNYLALMRPSEWQFFIDKKLGARQFFNLMFGSDRLYERYESSMEKLKKGENAATLSATLEDMRKEWIKLRDDKNTFYQNKEQAVLNEIAVYCLYDLYEKMGDMNKEISKLQAENSANNNNILQKASGSFTNVAASITAFSFRTVGATNVAAKMDGSVTFIKEQLCRAHKACIVWQVHATNEPTSAAPTQVTFEDFVSKQFEPSLSDFELMGDPASSDRRQTKIKIIDFKEDSELGKLDKVHGDLKSGAFFVVPPPQLKRNLSLTKIENV